MAKYYSPSTRGFYDSAVGPHPDDAVDITDEHHAALMEAQSQGMAIVPNVDAKAGRIGAPITVDAATLMTEQARARLKIRQLEEQITPRRLRDAVLTDAGRAWLTNAEAQIAALRSLKG